MKITIFANTKEDLSKAVELVRQNAGTFFKDGCDTRRIGGDFHIPWTPGEVRPHPAMGYAFAESIEIRRAEDGESKQV